MRPIKQYFIGFGLILLALVIGLGTFFYQALSPQLENKQILTRVAQEEGLTAQQDFQTFSVEETYYSLTAFDQDGKELLLVMTADAQEVKLIDPTEGLTANQMREKAEKEGLTVDRLTFGYYKDQAVWEVKSQATYYLYDFKTGDLVRQF
jgi:uncharacterized protein YpmB